MTKKPLNGQEGWDWWGQLKPGESGWYWHEDKVIKVWNNHGMLYSNIDGEWGIALPIGPRCLTPEEVAKLEVKIEHLEKDLKKLQDTVDKWSPHSFLQHDEDDGEFK